VSGALPARIAGGFGLDLQRFILALHFQIQVTALLNGMGVVISKRQVIRLLAKSAQCLAAEEAQVLRVGWARAPWITDDDTSARLAQRDGYTMQVGDNRSRRFAPAPRNRGRISCRPFGRGRASVSSTPPAHVYASARPYPVESGNSLSAMSASEWSRSRC
jgi:hypothetical protein